MSGLEDMRIRIESQGGKAQIDRMNRDKLNSLKKALLYSYQSATAILKDGREFRCLINPDKIKNEYDDKIISIPFEDVCLNEHGIQKIDMQPGDVFTWKENKTDWLVYLRRLEETAYFRAEIRRCKYSVDINNTSYKIYVARPSINEIDWREQDEKVWNTLDYTLQMYITKDENTESYLHRFAIVEIDNKPWEVQSIDSISSDGIIIAYLKEYYKNTIEKEKQEEDKNKEKPEIDISAPYIDGKEEVYPYEEENYEIKNAENGSWLLETNKAKIINQDSKKVKINIVFGRQGKFNLYYKYGENKIVKTINIKSL